MKIISKKQAFTLAEILIATSIFMGFLVSVFGFYNMGSKMFTSGSWRQNTQKKAELFLAKVKERTARISAPIKINNDGTIRSLNAYFGIASATIDYTTTKPKRIFCFPVCAASIKGQQGIIMYHILRAVSSTSNNKLFNLEFLATKSLNSGKGLEFVTGLTFNWFDNIFDETLFNGNANNLNLGPNNESVTVLKDVSKIEFSNLGKVINMDITFNDPSNMKTTLKLTTSVTCDENVIFDSRSDL